uniref:Uncharacterized protein n=1 Tax=Arundo donax TaxID=35708 RepID=A0A0A8YWX7_ARUDO
MHQSVFPVGTSDCKMTEDVEHLHIEASNTDKEKKITREAKRRR